MCAFAYVSARVRSGRSTRQAHAVVSGGPPYKIVCVLAFWPPIFVGPFLYVLGMADSAAHQQTEALDVLAGLFVAAPAGCSDSELADEMRTLQVMQNYLDGRFAESLGVFDARGGAAAEHTLSTQAWVRQHCLVSQTTAKGRLAVARRARTSDALRDAMSTGAIGFAHALVITRALDVLPPEAVGPAAEILVATARGADPSHLRRIADTIREAVAPQTLVTDTESVRDRRFLNISETLDGMFSIDGLLDPEAGALALAAVRALATPLGPDDSRTAQQRRADGFTEAIRAGLDAGTLPVTGGERPHLHLVVDFGRFLDGETPVAYTPTDSALAGETVRRILCDAQVTRIVTLGPSEVLDVGRATRTIPSAIRRALAIRDGGCVGHGCDRPPAFTDGHHVVHWCDGGATSLDNLALLCRSHHDLVHSGGWVLVRNGPGWAALPPRLAALNADAADDGVLLPLLPHPGLPLFEPLIV